MQRGIPTTEYFVRLSDLRRAIERNPYDEKEGNISAYMRYLKYNTKMADVRENVHGEWVLHEKPYMRECSNCKVWFRFDMPRNSFCPNCGADMRKGKET